MNNTTPANEERLALQIRAKRLEADNIYSFELVDPNGASLPPFCAGAHLEVYLAEGLVRHYSLSNSPSERGRYVIAVLKMESGRGGSLAMSRLQVGDTLVVSHPKNHFPMANTANHSVLIAGGIGITPILSMARALVESGQSFTLHYLARSRDTAAYVEVLQREPFYSSCYFHFQDEGADQILNDMIPSPNADSHLYVCGPNGLMDAVFATAAEKHWKESHLHREYFQAAATLDDAEQAAFEVELSSTGERFHIPADRSIFEVLDAAGYFIPCSCLEGVCGTCVTGVVEGQPDHRDVFLSQAEKDSNQLIAICCSRSKGKLVLDL